MEPVDQLSEQLNAVGIDVNSVELSPFEQFPSEVMIGIFEYVPEAVRNLRLTCRTLRRHVDAFVHRKATIPLATVAFTCAAMNPPRQPGFIGLTIYIPREMAAVFESRLKSHLNTTKIITRSDPANCEFQGRLHWKRARRIYYTLDMDISFATEAAKGAWEGVAASMGPQLDRAYVDRCYDSELTTVIEMLERFRFRNLTLGIGILSEDVVKQLFRTIDHHAIDSLSLHMAELAAPSPVDVLLRLSSVLRSLLIYQDGIFMQRFLLDERDWAPIILQMFSGRLDKLHFENKSTPFFFSHADVALLIEKLPYIGKKIWFRAPSFMKVRRGYRLNDHVIYESQPGPEVASTECTLSIVHKSRLTELSPRGIASRGY